MTDDPFERAVERVEAAAEREDAERRRRKYERYSAGQRKGFMIHATAFIAVQVLIFATWAVVWLTADEGYPWFVFPLLGWGVGLALHYVAVRDHVRPRRGGAQPSDG